MSIEREDVLYRQLEIMNMSLIAISKTLSCIENLLVEFVEGQEEE